MTVAVVALGRTAFSVDATHLYVERSPGTVDKMLTALTTVYNPNLSGCVSAMFDIFTRPVPDTSPLPFNQLTAGGGLPIAVHWKLTGEVSFTVRVAGPLTLMVGMAAENDQWKYESQKTLVRENMCCFLEWSNGPKDLNWALYRACKGTSQRSNRRSNRQNWL